MATMLGKAFGKLVYSVFTLVALYVAGLIFYTVTYGNSFAYNMGYSMGYMMEAVQSFF